MPSLGAIAEVRQRLVLGEDEGVDAAVVVEVAGGQATEIAYSPELFTFDKVAPPPGNIGFAGFRLHYPLNRPDYYDEVCTFLGASYFRAVAKGQGYGLSARGLAIKTADQSGEEFPVFKTFWLERPAPDVAATPEAREAIAEESHSGLTAIDGGRA